MTNPPKCELLRRLARDVIIEVSHLSSVNVRSIGGLPSTRRGGRVVEGAALEKRYTFAGIVGSNPTLSATFNATSQSPLNEVGGCSSHGRKHYIAKRTGT